MSFTYPAKPVRNTDYFRRPQAGRVLRHPISMCYNFKNPTGYMETPEVLHLLLAARDWQRGPELRIRCPLPEILNRNKR